MGEQPTQACVITPQGEGGIGIIALAGPRSSAVLDAVFVGTRRSAASLGAGAVAHGTIRRGGSIVDEVLVARVGESYEVNCHGGIVAVRTVLQCLREAGAQVVTPDEFAPFIPAASSALSAQSLRARAMALLPDAPTRLSAAMLLHQADGALRRAIEAAAQALEAGDADGAVARIEALLRTAAFGRALLHPPRVALLGPPNAGKSTLLNALLEEERVIVHDEPGTTRDVVRETLSLRGVPFDVMDAAGIRASDDDVERLAVDRAAALARSCEVALLVYDVREDPAAALVDLPPLPCAVRTILVANKLDLLTGNTPPPTHPPGHQHAPLVALSAKLRQGIDELEAALLAPYQDRIEPTRNGAPVVFDAATETALRRALRLIAAGSHAEALAILRAS